ncbi:FliI/YscN family ATPase [Acinetobacter sp. C26M]|uniref:FliI/YscN family ATPase n=1 Tax=unclassified Acinetobacter TaxID=196816 RepID=UPI002036AEEE|nr:MULTISPECIES: FliI/YscN family ATPase [unclassified Acinetobacter]USA45385.1 FliI/YscN family ATPase [Acinetobacter sp. C26M]USA48887.1 FliI/YscN family ATPase [Acinetobacter sp. C26G]
MTSHVDDIVSSILKKLEVSSFSQLIGRIKEISGVSIEATGLNVSIGEVVLIISNDNSVEMFAEVISVNDSFFTLMPFGDIHGLSLDCKVVSSAKSIQIPVSLDLRGRVFDALGQPIDGKKLPESIEYLSKNLTPINPLQRTPITQKLNTGIKAIDLFTPIGIGQRIGIFAGSGVGKSTLLGMLCKYATADVIVVALIGERGREVTDFLSNVLGEKGLKRSIVYVATAEQPAVFRRFIAYTATTVADWYRAKGFNVLLVMDSITRFAYAQREIGLAASEPTGLRGYPASVFSQLPPLVERGGALIGQGAITAIYTILVEGDDYNEPISDHMRSILDGHIMLDRALADKGHFPSINVLKSISRLSNVLHTKEQKNVISQLKQYLAVYEEFSDMIQLGAYQTGQNRLLDSIIKNKPKIDAMLVQFESEIMMSENIWVSAKNIIGEIDTVDE